MGFPIAGVAFAVDMLGAAGAAEWLGFRRCQVGAPTEIVEGDLVADVSNPFEIRLFLRRTLGEVEEVRELPQPVASLSFANPHSTGWVTELAEQGLIVLSAHEDLFLASSVYRSEYPVGELAAARFTSQCLVALAPLMLWRLPDGSASVHGPLHLYGEDKSANVSRHRPQGDSDSSI